MKTLRILALTSLVAGFGLMTGCDTTSSEGDAPVIKSLYVGDHENDLATFEFQANNTYRMVGTVENVSSWAWTILNSAGATVETLTADAPNGDGTTDLGLGSAKRVQFTPKASWGATGSYTIKGVLTGTDGSTLTKSFTIKAATGGTTSPAITAATLTLGSNSNSNGGSLDADAMVNYTIGQVTTALQGEIDLYYGYSAATAKDRFFTPAQAKLSSFTGISGWTVSNTVALYDLTSSVTEAAFNALATQADIDALFVGKTSAASVDASAGTVVGIVTSKGAKRVIRVNAITTGANGSVTIKGYK